MLNPGREEAQGYAKPRASLEPPREWGACLGASAYGQQARWWYPPLTMIHCMPYGVSGELACVTCCRVGDAPSLGRRRAGWNLG